MRLTGRAVLVLAALFSAASSWASDPPAKPSVQTVRVLFIGNSFVYTNDLPGMLASYAEATYPNLKVITGMVAPPGESWEGHWRKGEALHKIQEQRWDYVVLQDQASMPGGFMRVDGAVQHEYPKKFFEQGERFVHAVTAAQAKPILYQTFEQKKKADDLLYLDYAYMTLGRKLGAPVAPVARVWHRIHEAGHFDLYGEDGAHPSVQGTYLVAVTLAATIFGDIPPGAPVQHPAKMQEGEAREILAALRSVRQELAPAGGYADAPAPPFGTRPSLQSELPIDPAMAGRWYAKDNGIELSLGACLTLSFDAQAPKIELTDYTLNGTFPLAVSDVGVDGNVIHFTTTSQNRNYQMKVARRADGLEMLVELPRNTPIFNHSSYRREPADDYFDFLSRRFEGIRQQTTQEGFEAALLSYYEALTTRLGAEKLSKILLGRKEGPLAQLRRSPIARGWESRVGARKLLILRGRPSLWA